MKWSKRLAPKKTFKLEDKNTIIKIKGSGPGSLNTNWNGCKNVTNPAGSTKTNI
jgi:hypothetical protein